MPNLFGYFYYLLSAYFDRVLVCASSSSLHEPPLSALQSVKRYGRYEVGALVDTIVALMEVHTMVGGVIDDDPFA